ncbi:MAG: LysM peptidoglycan-binding domain-containing protein [Paludibacteraceae bacterium]|nr:LysM peptidoglycan-binding domain-containing protein [Paludibacteraceae bacterium]
MRICKHILCLIFILTLSLDNAWCKHRKHHELTLRDSLVEYAQKHIGCKYKYGSRGPKAFDCSGFTYYVFQHFGYTLNSSSSSQYLQGEKIKYNNTEKGDLIFFKGSKLNSKAVGHVGIIINKSEKQDTVWFIHASVQRGISIDSYPGYEYYNKRYIGCKRIIGELASDKEEDFSDDEKEKEEEEKEKGKKEDSKPEKETQPSDQDSLSNDTSGQNEEIPQNKPLIEPTEETQVVHIVKKGDNLYRISKQYGCKVDDIIKWNKLKNNNLKIGQKLLINPDNPSPQSNEEKKAIDNHSKDEKNEITPAPSDTTDVKKESSDQDKSVNKDEKPKEDNGNSDEKSEEVTTHIVKKGETLYRIGKQYGCTAEEIMKWNQMKNANLRIGQQLIIKR